MNKQRLDDIAIKFELDGIIAAEDFKEVVQEARRYEKIRRLNVTQFGALYYRNIRGEAPFDQLVDELEG